MAIKTFINGQENGVITFKDDTEPCAVYVNGERQDNISYIPTLAEGVDSATYTSEYKNNLRSLQIEGNTVQETYRGVNLFNINAPLLASPFSIEKSAKPKIENGIIYSGGYNEATLGGIDGCFLFVATNGDGDYTFSFDATCDAIESGMRYWIVGTAEVDGTTNETGPWDYISSPTDITGNGKYTLTVDNNGYEYIGIAFYSPTQYNIAVTNLQIEKGSVATAYEKYVGGTSVPTIANPRTITNCGNSQVDITIKGVNEFDISKIRVKENPNISITDVGENSITVTSYNSTSAPNGYCGTGVKLSAICPNIKVGKAYQLTLNNSGGANKSIYLSGVNAIWGSGTAKIITEDMLNSTVVLYGHNFQTYPDAELPVNVVIFDIVLTEVENLFDQDAMLNGTTFTKAEYDGFDCIKVVSTGRLDLDLPVSIPSGKKVYTYINSANPNGTLDFYTYLKYEDGTYSSALASRTNTTVNANFVAKDKSVTTDKNVVAIQFRFYGSYPAYYFKDIVLTVFEQAPYEPYIKPTTASIPANVVLESGANENLLELAKIGDYADTITIDRVNNEVKYTQRICRVRPFENVGGALSYGGGSAGTHNIWTFALNKTSIPYIAPMCEFARVLNDDNYASLGADEFGVFFAYEDYVYIYIPSSLGITSAQALEDYLTQTQGERLSIEYVLETPIERTITDDMGANDTPDNLKTMLLDWARNTKNQTNIIEITSTPSVTKTSVNYAKWGGVPNENNT